MERESFIMISKVDYKKDSSNVYLSTNVVSALDDLEDIWKGE